MNLVQPFTPASTAAAYGPEQEISPLAIPSARLLVQAFQPLEQVTRPTFNTEEAAYYLNRKAQTLRRWACYEDGPIRPIRIHGRLAWSVASIIALLKGGQ